MISKNRLKELAGYRLQKRCDEEAVFVVEGPKMAAEALASGFRVRAVCATAEWLAARSGHVVADEVCEVSQAELERLSGMKAPNQVWMLLDRPDISTYQHINISTAGTLTLALDRIQDPGNMGTLMRTADWFGVRRIVCSADTVSCFNPKVVQASMGAVFRTRVEYTDLPAWLAVCGMEVYGASLQGQPLSGHWPLATGPSVLLIGNESRGISAEAMAHVTQPVLIPNLGGTAESLNAAVAAGILMYHLTK